MKSPHQVSIHGMGGVGKTQILLRYADMHRPNRQLQTSYDYIFFVNASTAGSITQSVLSIANALGLPQGTSSSDTTRTLHQWLFKERNWLLIFDNAESLDDIEEIRPPLDTGHVLFSTRHGDIASLLINGAKPIEILPMDKATATYLAHSKCQKSLLEEDRELSVAADVSSFARGLPLAIEQVIHDSFFSKRAIRNTLHLVRQKQVLLEQNNRSSLHGPNSSIAAIIEQTLVDIRSRHPPAATLFSILAYWDPSSMPMSLLRAGVTTIPALLQRPHLFARDTVTDGAQHMTNAAAAAPSSPSLWDHDPFKVDTWRILFRRGLRQQSSSDARRRTLPGETGLEADFRVAFGEGTTLHELFSDVVFVNRAIQILYEAALIRYIGNDRIWMHDLYCEVAQALVERENIEAGHQAATTASTLVYLAFPNPRLHATPNNRRTCMQYLPHAIKCHRHLKTMEILNNLSIGPELSHIVASTIDMQYGVRRPASKTNDPLRTATAINRYRIDAIQYYRHAFVGYIACHIRLKSAYRSRPRQVLRSVAADTEGVRARGYGLPDFTGDFHRCGQTPLYRAFQTIIRLELLLWHMPDEAGMPETVSMWKFLVEWFGALFGSCHDSTSSARRRLSTVLFAVGSIEESYTVAIDSLKATLGWDEKKRVFKPTNVYHSFGVYYSSYAAGFCEQAGECCLQLPGESRGREAVVYFKILLKYAENSHGEEHLTCIMVMQKLAMAYEKANERVAAIYWYGRSVLCRLNILVWEGATYADGDPACPEMIRYSNDEFLEDTVHVYERARERLGSFDSSKLSLHQFLIAVDSKITLWRTDRQKNGCPYDIVDQWPIERKYDF